MVTDLFLGLSCLTLVFGAPANQVQSITNIKDAAMLLIFKKYVVQTRYIQSYQQYQRC